MQLAATMIDGGQVDYALIVDGEGSRRTQELTLDRLAARDATADDLWSQFASLTLGSGGAAMVLGRADQHPEGHRLVGGVAGPPPSTTSSASATSTTCAPTPRRCSRPASQLSIELWEEAKSEFDWSRHGPLRRRTRSRKVHSAAICKALDIDARRSPLSTFPTRGNIGPAAVPITLAIEADSPARRATACCSWASARASTPAALEIVW